MMRTIALRFSNNFAPEEGTIRAHEALVRKLIERITVYDDYFTVEFKSGIEIDVRL